MRYVLPLALLVGLAGCVGYDGGYAYQSQYQPGYSYSYNNGIYNQGYVGGYASYGTCGNTPFVWGTCSESPVD